MVRRSWIPIPCSPISYSCGISSDDVGEALGRLFAIALPKSRATSTGASRKVADFLLAWWNGAEAEHFSLLQPSNVDETIGEDMLTIMAYLAQNPVIYADQRGYKAAMGEIWERYRGE